MLSPSPGRRPSRARLLGTLAAAVLATSATWAAPTLAHADPATPRPNAVRADAADRAHADHRPTGHGNQNRQGHSKANGHGNGNGHGNANGHQDGAPGRSGSHHADGTPGHNDASPGNRQRDPQHPGPRHSGPDRHHDEPGTRGHAGTGHDDDQHREPSRQAREERLVALASGWVLDPALVKVRPEDSKKTRTARAQLTGLAETLHRSLARYDRAAAAAAAARDDAAAAQLDLAAAQVASAQAGVRYVRSQEALSAMARGQYTEGETSTFSLLLDPAATEALRDLSLLDLVGDRHSDTVAEAAAAAEDLTEATDAVADAEARAAVALVDAETALTEATETRRAAVAETVEMRKVVEAAMAADAQARAAEEAAMSALAEGIYIRPKGKVSFPLPPDASFVDNDNWGGSGSMWSAMHTGNDLSAPCGTPVLAATNGTIEIRTDQGWSGAWLVMVTTGPGELATWYAHMESLTVEAGEKVKAGQQIGTVGTEGNSTGCHLHFEYHPLGGSIYEDSTDPVTWWRTLGIYPTGS